MLRHSLCHRKRPRFPSTPLLVEIVFAKAVSTELAQRVRTNALHTYTDGYRLSRGQNGQHRISKCRLRASSSSKKQVKAEDKVLQVSVKPDHRRKSVWSRFASLLAPVLVARTTNRRATKPSETAPNNATNSKAEANPRTKANLNANIRIRGIEYRPGNTAKGKTRSERWQAEEAAAATKATIKSKSKSKKSATEVDSASTKRASAVTAHKSGEKKTGGSKGSQAKEATARQRRRASRSKPSELLTLTRRQASGRAIAMLANTLHIEALDLDRTAVPQLEYGLDRVLFNSGIYQLQDARSRVYNFDPYLKDIMPLVEFDFDTIKEYKTSSRDETLRALAETHRKKYVGSTSSMTGTLSHFHFLLSNWRRLDHQSMSRGFPPVSDDFTKIAKAPNAIFLRYNPETKTYAIDADKEFDSPNVLMLLGKSMELLLTKPTNEYERHKKGHQRPITEEERSMPETYQYTTMGDFLMRSQLDAHDPRLPGTGMFDLKTRAVLPVRMNSADYEPMIGYQLQTLRGNFSSYEREIYDMTRSTMLKYLLQVRMGRMDGIFVAYHNVEQIFGFQYLPVSELDSVIHGTSDTTLGDAEFKFSLRLLNEVLEMATKKFPGQSLRLHFETQHDSFAAASMVFFAEPVDETEIERIQALQNDKIAEFERKITGADSEDTERDGTKQQLPETSSSPPTSSTNDSAPPMHAPAPSPDTSTASQTVSTPSSDGSAPTPDLDTADSGPLLMGGITITNWMKLKKGEAWKRCEGNRAHNVHPGVDLKVDYLIHEVRADDSTISRHYAALKNKRKRIFTRHTEEKETSQSSSKTISSDGDAAPEVKPKKDDKWINFLRALSARGRIIKKEMEALELGKDKIVVGWPRMEASIVEQRIQSVDDYMDWMFEPPAAPQPVRQDEDDPEDPFDAYHNASLNAPMQGQHEFFYLDDKLQERSKPARRATRATPTQAPLDLDDYLRYVYDPLRSGRNEKSKDPANSDAFDLIGEVGERPNGFSVDEYMKMLYGKENLRGKFQKRAGDHSKRTGKRRW